MYEKKNKKQKNYEVAHIYPLNPKPQELIDLRGAELINPDVNHLDNLIPLCTPCHTKFDKPRTLEEYNELLKIKNELLRKFNEHDIIVQYIIEDDLRKIIEELYSYTEDSVSSEKISYDPKTIDSKLNSTIANLTKSKIKANVSSYYLFIKRRLAELDSETGNAGELISLQIKTFYKKQLQKHQDQQLIFLNMVGWIQHHFKPQTIEASEIMVSFFIQNCEIFDDNTK